MASIVARPASQSQVGIFISTSLENGNDVVNGKGAVVNRRKSSATNLAVRAFLDPEAHPLGLLRARAHAIDHFLKLSRLRRMIFAFTHDLWLMAPFEDSIGNRHREVRSCEDTFSVSRSPTGSQLAASADRCISRSFDPAASRCCRLARKNAAAASELRTQIQANWGFSCE